MRHCLMYQGGFERNFPNLKPGTTTFQGTDGGEHSRPVAHQTAANQLGDRGCGERHGRPGHAQLLGKSRRSTRSVMSSDLSNDTIFCEYGLFRSMTNAILSSARIPSMIACKRVCMGVSSSFSLAATFSSSSRQPARGRRTAASSGRTDSPPCR